MYVRSIQVCLEQSIFIFQGQRAIQEQRAMQGQLEYKNQSHTVWAYKYCVLLFDNKTLTLKLHFWLKKSIQRDIREHSVEIHKVGV